jgi:molybdate transport system substrate-binding protein
MKVWILAAILALAPQAALAKIVVFAPSSMTDVIGALAAFHEERVREKVVVSLASTSQLARQLDAGAPADIFLTADESWMDWAQDRALVEPSSTITFAGNRLVVVTAKEAARKDWPRALEQGRFAMAEPEAVPAGRYTKAALTSLSLWRALRPNVVFAENVRITLRLAARGDVDAAIVYRTDANIEPAVAVAYTFDPKTHPPIRYFAAETPDAAAGAAAFLETLGTDHAQAILKKAGFSLPPFER